MPRAVARVGEEAEQCCGGAPRVRAHGAMQCELRAMSPGRALVSAHVWHAAGHPRQRNHHQLHRTSAQRGGGELCLLRFKACDLCEAHPKDDLQGRV